jgi:hypothetical protein
LRAVPTKASGLHGSDNLIVHESLHGYDYIRNHKPLKDKDFVAARTADFGKLGPYERQEGRAGLEETFAESGAKYVAAAGGASRDVAKPPRLLVGYRRRRWPRDGRARTRGLVAEEAATLEEGRRCRGGDRHRRIWRRRRDPARPARRGDNGAIGHAMLTIAPGDDAYGEVNQQLAAARPRKRSAALRCCSGRCGPARVIRTRPPGRNRRRRNRNHCLERG